MPNCKQVQKFLLTLDSKNHKTGKMPVSTSPDSTCPESCPFRNNGCYADYGPIKIWWEACSQVRANINKAYNYFLRRVRDLIPEGMVWRHNQCGDLMPENGHANRIDVDAAIALAEANRGKRGYTYTHFPVIEQKGTSKVDAAINRMILQVMNTLGFTVNISANSINHADAIKAAGVKSPVNTVLPERYMKEGIRRETTPGGNVLIVCPNPTQGITCTEGLLCMQPKRKTIIGFPAHGTGKKRAEAIFEKWERDYAD